MEREGLTWGRPLGRHGTSQGFPHGSELRFLEYPDVLSHPYGSFEVRQGEDLVWQLSIQDDLQGC